MDLEHEKFSSCAGKKMNKMTLGFAVLSLLLSVVLVLQNLGVISLILKSDGGDGQRMEGPGYDSAEDAAKAYIEAMSQGDVDGMLSTFAIETYVDNCDTEANLSLMGMWHVQTVFSGALETVGGNYERKLRYASRQASIIQVLYSQLLIHSAYLADDGVDLSDIYTPVVFDDENDIREFLRIYHDSPFNSALANMKLEEFINPEDLIESYSSETNLNNMEKQRIRFGCDEYKSVAARVTLNGENWFFTMDCGNYGGRWYNLNLSSDLSMMLGVSAQEGGMCPYSEMEL